MNIDTQPSWWTEERHGSAWGRVKEAMKRDWEQTKHDLRLGGRELGQDVDDTVKQAAGKEAIPSRAVPNAPHMPKAQPSGAPARRDTTTTSGTLKTGANTFDDDYRRAYTNDLAWDDVEGPMAFGYGAREQYGTQYAQWDDTLEARLRNDWETSGTLGEKTRRKWEDVKAWVRMGFDRARTT
jgi:hypothetical protein